MAKGKRSRRSASGRRHQAAQRPSGPQVSRPVSGPKQAKQPATARPAVPKTSAQGSSAHAGAPAKATTAPDFTSEYRYVLGDLKRLGIIAASMFATLIVLALVLR